MGDVVWLAEFATTRTVYRVTALCEVRDVLCDAVADEVARKLSATHIDPAQAETARISTIHLIARACATACRTLIPGHLVATPLAYYMAWRSVDIPISIAEAVTRVDLPRPRGRPRGMTAGSVVIICLMSSLIAVATCMALMWSGVAGVIVGIAAQVSGLATGYIMTRRSEKR